MRKWGRRQVNAKFILVFLVAVALLAGLVHLLHGYQIQRNGVVFLREARQAKERKDAGTAVRFYQMYLDIRSNDVEVLAEYGLFLADLSQWGPAYSTLERVLRLDGGRVEVRRKLATVAMELGRLRDAREHLLLLQKVSPRDPELVELMARCEAGQGNYLEAAKLFRGLIEQAPDRFPAYVLLADLLDRRLGQPAEAEKVLTELVERFPQACTAWALRADYLRGKRRFEEALVAAQRAIELDPQSVGALLVAAECAREKRQFDQALAFVERALEVAPKALQAYQVKANIEVAAGKSREAIATIEAARKLDPRNQELQWHLALLQVEAGEIAQAEDQLAQLERERYSSGLLDYLRGRIAIARGEWRLARQLLRRARGLLAPEPEHVKFVDYWLGVVEGQLGNRDEQLLAFRRAIAADPFWVPARLGAASALAALGQTEQAIQESRQAFVLSGQRAEAGIQVLSLLVLRNLVAPQLQANWEEAERLVKALEETSPEEWRTTLLKAEILVAQKKVEEARQLLAQAREKWPREVEVWLAGVALERRQREFEQAEKLLAEAEHQLGDNMRVRLARAQYLVERYGEGAAEEIRRLAEGTSQWTGEDRGQLLVGLGAYLMQVGDYGTARTFCSEGAELLPHNLRARILLFDLALRAEDLSALGRVVKEIEEIEGRGALWHYGRAVELVLLSIVGKENRYAEARSLLMQAAALRPAWSRIPLLLAEIAERQNDQEQALNYYQRAFDLGEDNPRAIRRLLQLLYERQRYAEADRVLRRLEELRAPFTGELVRLASEISLRLQEFDRALELARQSAALSKDYRDRVWLGQVLGVLALRARAEGRTAQAEAMLADAEREFREALALNSQAVDAWVALVRFYQINGQSEKAEAALGEAEKTLVAGLGPLALAHCLTLLGRFDEAESVYQKALAAEPENAAVIRAAGEFYLLVGKQDLAAQQLEKLVGKKGQAGESESDLRWARRMLGFVLFQRGDYPSIARGLQVLEPNLRENPPAPADLRVQALLLSQHPQRKRREEAQRILERLIDRADVSDPRDRYVLARLYVASGELVKATQQLRTLLAAEPKVPEYVAFYLRVLLARDDVAEAEVWIRRLNQLAPESYETADIQAEIHARRGRIEEAAAALRQFLEQKVEIVGRQDSEPSEAAAESPSGTAGTVPESQFDTALQVRTGLVAASLMRLSLLLQQRGDTSGAEALGEQGEELFRAFAAKVPTDRQADAQLALASFIARRGRLEEALGYVRQWGQQASPPFLRVSLSAIVPSLPENSPHWREIKQLVAQRLPQQPGELSLLLLAGELAFLTEDYPEAEKIYRKILEEDPQSFVGLNNLAVTLVILGRDLPQAERLARQALEMAGPRPDVLDTVAQVLLARGRAQEALKLVQEAIEDTPQPVLYIRQAQILHQMQQHAAARKSLQQAEKLDLRLETLAPSDRSIYRTLRRELMGSGASS